MHISAKEATGFLSADHRLIANNRVVTPHRPIVIQMKENQKEVFGD